MKKLSILLACFYICNLAFSQNYKITWGDELKLKKGTADLDIIAADRTGLYFSEERLKRRTISFAQPSNSEIKLSKVDKNYSEVFDKEYKKELKGIDFHSFQTLGNDIYMFATDYEKKGKLFKTYGAKVDKNSGDLVNDFMELGSYALESKKDDYQMKVTPIQNGNAFLMVSNISGNDKVSLGISVLDNNFKEKENAVITLNYDNDHFGLQDVQYTSSNKIVVLGKEFEEELYGKRKRKRYIFKQYVMMVYNNKGVKEKEVALNAGDRFIISGKLIEEPTGQLLLAGFYSNQSKKDDLNGFYINKVDPINGIMTLSSFKEINSGMLGKAFDDGTDDDDDDRKNKKEAKKAKDDDDEDEFPNSFIIRSVDINPVDNSIIITSEVSQYSSYTYSSSTYNPSTHSWDTRTTIVHRFTNKDIMIINADKDGNIKWLNDLPKSQFEEVRSSNTSRGMGIGFWNDYSSYFAEAGGMPYYSSYASLLNNNKLVIILNDHTSNNVNPTYGDKVKTVSNFKKKSNTYGVSIDLVTGQMTRKFINSNNEETILMPRHAMVVSNEFYMPSWRIRLMAKTELKFAKITIQ